MDGKLRAVLFDFDGTIAETERDGHRVAYNRAFAELGLNWNWDEEFYGKLLVVAGGKERLLHYVKTYRPEVAARLDLQELIGELHRVKARNFREVAARIALRPGVRRLIGEAHAGALKVAIVTTASEDGVRALLAQDSALLDAIDLIAAGDVVARKKPAPDVYVWALERLAVSPQHCVAIEDSHIGLRSALQAGIATVVTVSDYAVDQDFAGAVSVVSDLGEPGQPARSLQGLSPHQGVVDVAFLSELLDSKNRR